MLKFCELLNMNNFLHVQRYSKSHVSITQPWQPSTNDHSCPMYKSIHIIFEANSTHLIILSINILVCTSKRSSLILTLSLNHTSCSVAKLCLTLCKPRNCSTPGFPVLYYLPEFVQIPVRWISDAIQSSHPLLPASPSVLSLLEHQGHFQWISS